MSTETKSFHIIVDETGVTFRNDGFLDYELVGLLELIQADVRVQFISRTRLPIIDSPEPPTVPAASTDN
jgi:hypothetical protein